MALGSTMWLTLANEIILGMTQAETWNALMYRVLPFLVALEHCCHMKQPRWGKTHCLLERKDTLLLLPWPAARHMNEAIVNQLATNHPSSWSQTLMRVQHQSAMHARPDLNNPIVNARNHEISCRLKSLSFAIKCHCPITNSRMII